MPPGHLRHVSPAFLDVALLRGSYFERLTFPGQPVSEQNGRFAAQWVRQGDGRWLIQRLLRVPAQ